ncbi:MAG: tRNA uridine-5-carboxymethylaminomethyl(34) synthesis GTPase MnmE [Flammeovirgaceae bacterium]
MSLLRQSMTDTIIALATPVGRGAIAVFRLSGTDAIKITQKVFKSGGKKTKDLEKQASHTIHFGTLLDAEGQIIDEVLVSLFKAPKSYTGENVVEISAHGSPYIIQRIIRLFQEQGVRYARAGEFTKRAFLNGKLDLAQAEAVADLIASETEAAHKAAIHQMRGGFSKTIRELREKLIHFASLIELELDFGEEDVEFADRKDVRNLIIEIQQTIAPLIDSFAAGNVIKNGIPVVIAGKPNAGKSTLLNALLNEEKAIVSEIAGTTRDFIEDELVMQGISFRFIDTAGLRETSDAIEKIGVERAKKKIKEASLLLYIFDSSNISDIQDFKKEYEKAISFQIPMIMVGNKSDVLKKSIADELEKMPDTILISAKEKTGLEELTQKMLEKVQSNTFQTGNTVITNARHYESLINTQKALYEVLSSLDAGMTGDLLALDIRNALHSLGEITGEITTDDLLANIFSKFCIGK